MFANTLNESIKLSHNDKYVVLQQNKKVMFTFYV